MAKRKKTKVIKIGNLKIGGNFPIAVQSMTNTVTSDIEKTCKQIKELEKTGCEIIRVGIPDFQSAKAIPKIKRNINIPLVADIHFSDQLAIEAIKQGADKIRINPGNFPKKGLKEIVYLASKRNLPIRIGVNSGSLEKDLLREHKKATPEMMVESALKNVKLMEDLGFYNIVISLKAPDIQRTVKAYELLSSKTDYPLHLGITEAGTEFSGSIKSAIGLGNLLSKGIGDTLRVSLSADPAKEVKVAWEILKSLELRKKGIRVVSCPTCARTGIDVIKISNEIEKMASFVEKPLRVAVMGCVVNGLGEGREADLAIVGTAKGLALLMKKGEIAKKGKEKEMVQELKKEIEEY